MTRQQRYYCARLAVRLMEAAGWSLIVFGLVLDRTRLLLPGVGLLGVMFVLSVVVARVF